MAYKGQKFITYSKEFKISFLKKAEDISILLACKKYNVNRNTAESWKRSFASGRLGIGSGRPLKSPQVEDLQEQIEILKKFRSFQQKAIIEKQNLFKKI